MNRARVRPGTATGRVDVQAWRPAVHRAAAVLALAAAGVTFAACGTNTQIDPSARVVHLPEASQSIDFDDTTYSPELQRVVVPARQSGVYLVDAATATATRVPYDGRADSADAAVGVIFAADRADRQIHVLDPGSGRVLSSTPTSGAPDYVRYVPSVDELWVTEPGGNPSGIETFRLRDEAQAALQATGSIPVPDGPEGLTLSQDGGTAYTHAGTDLVVIDAKTRTITHRWPTGCDGTHGFPRADATTGFVLASCAADGKVVLLDATDGRVLGHYSVGGGESLPAYSAATHHFYVRSDPGDKIVTLDPSRGGLAAVGQVSVPQVGHCLGADSSHYWTCDAERGQLLLFEDK